MSPARTRKHQHRESSNVNSHLHSLQFSDAEPDIDSDQPNIERMAAHHSNTVRTNEELNLTVLQRHNPLITNVLSIAPYAVIYTFSSPAQAWEKTGTEGTLFVCAVQSEEDKSWGILRYVVVVLNRRGLENFQLELMTEDNVEVTDEFIIIQEANGTSENLTQRAVHGDSSTSVVYGLWIFSEPPPSSTAGVRDLNARVIQNCAAEAEASRKIATLRMNQHSNKNTGNNHGVSPAEDCAPMTRQLSLRELFGKHRKEDDTLITPIRYQKTSEQSDVLTDLFRNAKLRHQANH